MDVQMPVMDGFTATRFMRERGQRMPILALTANAMKGFEADIVAAGFSGHLTKPVDIDTMLATIAQHLGGTRGPAAGAAPAPVSVAVVEAAAAEPIVSRLAKHPRLQHVVRSFALQLPDKLQAMDEALAHLDLAELQLLAHWLKGAGGTVGYDVFFEPARDLELHAQRGELEAVRSDLAVLHSLAVRIVVPAAPLRTLEAAA
jgi:DNA-binding response OmpR family regulator